MTKDNSKTHKTYLSLNTELYDLTRTNVSEEEFVFYMSYVRESNGTILEPMCGSGRFLIPIIEAGFNIDGFDASPFMLKALYQKCETKNVLLSKCKIWEGFLQTLNVSERYGLIFIPDGSFNLIINIEEIKLCLNKIYEHLEDNGRFVFELVTLKYAKQIEIGTTNNSNAIRPDGKHIYKWVHILPFEGQIANTKSYCELHDKGKVLKIEMEDTRLFLHNPNDIELWLKEIGFRDIKRLKAFDRTQMASIDDPIIVFECIK